MIVLTGPWTRGELELRRDDYGPDSQLTAAGECSVTVIDGPVSLVIHNMTAKRLIALAGKLMDAAQQQNDADGRRALAEKNLDPVRLLIAEG